MVPRQATFVQKKQFVVILQTELACQVARKRWKPSSDVRFLW